MRKRSSFSSANLPWNQDFSAADNYLYTPSVEVNQRKTQFLVAKKRLVANNNAMHVALKQIQLEKRHDKSHVHKFASVHKLWIQVYENR